MEINLSMDLLWQQISNTGALEWVAVCFGVTEVLLARKDKVLLYPAGIISICAGAVVLIQAKLYAETLLNAYYLVMSIYGWAKWNSKSGFGAPQISRSSKIEQLVSWGIALVGWGVLYGFLTGFTDSDVPLLDSLISSTAWAGMWLLAKRKLENWIWLNISNLIAIPLLIYKGLILFAILTVFLFVVAIFGYLDWKKKLENDPYELQPV